jgi:hypothetical protein
MELFTYPKEGLAAGANAVAEATTAAKQNAVFMVKSTESTRKLCFTTSHPLKPTTVQHKRTQTTFPFVAYHRRAETTSVEHVLTWIVWSCLYQLF